MAFCTGSSSARSAAVGADAVDIPVETMAEVAGGRLVSFAIGRATAETVNNNMAAETSRLANIWVPPENGTRAGIPTRRSPA